MLQIWRSPAVIDRRYSLLPNEQFQNLLRTRAIVRHGAAHFVGSKVRGAAGKIIIHAGEPNSCIHRRRTRTKLKVEIGRFVQGSRVGSGGRDFHKYVVVHGDAVTVLVRGLAIVFQRFEPSYFPRAGFELRLLLGGKLSGLTGKVGASPKRRRAPLEGKLRAFVRAETVVVRARIVGVGLDREGLKRFAFSQDQVIAVK